MNHNLHATWPGVRSTTLQLDGNFVDLRWKLLWFSQHPVLPTGQCGHPLPVDLFPLAVGSYENAGHCDLNPTTSIVCALQARLGQASSGVHYWDTVTAASTAGTSTPSAHCMLGNMPHLLLLLLHANRTSSAAAPLGLQDLAAAPEHTAYPLLPHCCQCCQHGGYCCCCIAASRHTHIMATVGSLAL
jgi:hypothetical protein